MPESLTYKQLKSTNPKYDCNLYEELNLLYIGGYEIVKHAKRFISPMIGESTARYNERLKCASYIPYLSEVVDNFSSALFSQELSIHAAADADNESTPGVVPDPEYYQAFGRNADLKGTSFARLMRQVFPEALLKGRCLIGLDFPRNEDHIEIVNRADEVALGLDRAYAYSIPIEQLLDWEYDNFGAFSWCILNRVVFKRNSPLENRDTYVEEFKIWTKNPDTGLAEWSLYRSNPYKVGQKIGDKTLIDCVDYGTTSFKQIPIIELALPEGLVVGVKIGSLCKEHFCRRTALNSAQNKSLVAMPVVKLGPEISSPGGALPSEVQMDPSRGQDPVSKFNSMGFIVVGAGDSVEFVEPAGHAYKLIAESLTTIKDELFRTVGMMAASAHNISYSVGRSGASKQQDQKSQIVLLTAYGAMVRDFALRIYNAISAARNEHIVWVSSGLDSYDTTDREEVVKESLQLDAVAIPSKTFKAHYKIRTALSLVPNLPHDTTEQIRKEIIAGVESEDELRLMVHAHEESELSYAIENPEPETPAVKQVEKDLNIQDND